VDISNTLSWPNGKQKMMLKRRMRVSRPRPDWLPLFGGLEGARWAAEERGADIGRDAKGIVLDR
jgi:hypothetical protein